MNLEKWNVLLVPASDDTTDAISNFLFEIGSVGVVEQYQGLHAYFPSVMNVQELTELVSKYIASLEDMGFNVSHQQISSYSVEDKDWNAEWKKNLKPIKITDSVMIKPTWCELPENAPSVVVEIDPEMAFGTGTHATTFLCLELLENRVKGKIILDIGTGTGILAIAAIKLGAAQAFAFDVDPVATETARKNAGQNRSSEHIVFFTGVCGSVKNVQFDMIIANINRTQILLSLPMMNDLLKAGGTLILSGILDVEENMIADELAKLDYQIVQVKTREEWIAIECVKPVS